MPDKPPAQPSAKVQAALTTLLDGTENQRDDLLSDVRTLLDPSEQAELKELVIEGLRQNLDHTPSNPTAAGSSRGWLASALGVLEPFDDRSENWLADLATSTGSEWVSYWSLAHLYWRRAERVLRKTVEVILSRPRGRSDLVAALTTVVEFKLYSGDVRELVSALDSRDGRNLWVTLRALQVVGIPEVASDVAALLPADRDDQINYDVLMVLTGHEMGDSGLIALRDHVSAERVILAVLRAARDVGNAKVRRFARILKHFEPKDLIGLSRAVESAGPDAATAQRLIAASGVTPPPTLVLQPGSWRAEFAYRAVLEQPARYELLDNFDAAGLREAVRAVAGGASGSPEEILAPLRTKDSSSPNQLWSAWIETVHAQKLQH